VARWRERPEDGLRERARAALGWDPGTDGDLLWLAAGLLAGQEGGASGEVA
jgi:hypothetical protein